MSPWGQPVRIDPFTSHPIPCKRAATDGSCRPNLVTRRAGRTTTTDLWLHRVCATWARGEPRRVKRQKPCQELVCTYEYLCRTISVQWNMPFHFEHRKMRSIVESGPVAHFLDIPRCPWSRRWRRLVAMGRFRHVCRRTCSIVSGACRHNMDKKGIKVPLQPATLGPDRVIRLGLPSAYSLGR